MDWNDFYRTTALVDGLEVIGIDEEDQDGPSAVGPKHSQVFDIVARRPDAGGL